MVKGFSSIRIGELEWEACEVCKYYNQNKKYDCVCLKNVWENILTQIYLEGNEIYCSSFEPASFEEE